MEEFKSLVPVGWDFKLGPVSRINAIARLKDRSLVFDEEKAREGLQNFTVDLGLFMVAAVIWLKYC